MPSPEERAWAAGFFDGEGNCYAYRRTSGARMVKMQIAQVDRRVLNRFLAIVGVGKVYGPYGPYKGNRKEYWLWSTTTQVEALSAFDTLRDFLSPVKTQQIQEATDLAAA